MSNNLTPFTIKIIGLSFEFITTFTIIWFLIIMMVLPFNIKETEEDNNQGFASSAPKEPKIKQKMLITSAISFVVTIIIQLLINNDVINIRDLIR